MAHALLGRKRSIESRKKQSDTRKGLKHSENTKRKIGLSNAIALKGRKQSLEVRMARSQRMKGRVLSNEWKRNISKAKLGSLNPQWRGGVSNTGYDVDWTRTLRRSIRERDNYICQMCSQYGNDVHHIDYDKKNSNPNNLMTLCRSCHIKTNSNRNYWKSELKEYK